MELFHVKTLEEIHHLLDTLYEGTRPKTEWIPYESCVGRILAQTIAATENVPSFKRSTVDGYAVIASETAGASDSIPAFLAYKGEAFMGQACTVTVDKGQTLYVPTGAQVPAGADAVVMIEYAEAFGEERAIYKPVRSKENIMDIGDDVAMGQVLIPEGTKLRPTHIAVLAALGLTTVCVYRKPLVSILSTGDELIDPAIKPTGTQIRDVNGPTLSAFIEAAGCTLLKLHRLPDDEKVLFEALKEAVNHSDLVLISGGSSVGKQDKTPELISALGSPGVLAHGIAMKPGKPTIVGFVEGCAVFGLPGQPTSCMLSYTVVVQRLIQKHLLRQREIPYTLEAVSDFQLHSASGRTELVLVKLKRREDGYSAVMIPGKSGMVTLLSEGVGYVEVPMSKGGIVLGEQVKVQLFQPIHSGEIYDA